MDEIIEGLIQSTVEERGKARGAPFTAEEVEAIREEVCASLGGDVAPQIANLIKEGADVDFRRMAILSGLGGAAALLESIINHCPNLTPGRRETLKRQMLMPDGIKLNKDGLSAGMNIEFPASRREAGCDGAVKFTMYCGAVPPSHNLEEQFAPIVKLATPEELTRVQNQASILLTHARMAYEEILAANSAQLLPKLEKKMGPKMAEEFEVATIHADPVNRTMFLSYDGVDFEPRCGIIIREM